MAKLKTVIIEGAGLIGPCYAALLSDMATRVVVYEKRPYCDCTRTYGKSVNLALGSKGWRMFQALGYVDEVKKFIVPMEGRMIHGLNDVTKRNTQSYGYYENGQKQTLDAFSRLNMSLHLIELAQTKPNVNVFFGVGIERVDVLNNTLILTNGEVIDIAEDDLVIAAGGVNSEIRKSLQAQKLIQVERKMLNYSYVEIEMPTKDGTYVVPPNHLHIWPKGQQMFAALPNPDGTVTGAMYAPQQGHNSFNDIYSMGAERFFTKNFPALLELIPDFLVQFKDKTPSQLSEVRCNKWHHKNIVIVGDAAHAVTPFLGQGMNFSMHLALELNNLLRTSVTTADALEAFELFKPDAERLADWSEKNFHEMSGTDSPQLQLRKEIEAQLEVECPSFASFHTQVCFREILYADIEAGMTRADAAFAKVLQLPNIYTEWKTTLWDQVVQMMMAA